MDYSAPLSEHSTVFDGQPTQDGISPFTRRLIAANGLEHSGFSNWLFYPGMFFLDRNKWWGNGGPRRIPHEGRDLCFYRTHEGKQCRLGPQTRLPAITGGRVLRIIDDFLGKSIVVRHAGRTENGWRICTVYGHTQPLAGLSHGSTLESGEIIATLSESGRSKGPGPHLHVSLALVSGHLRAEYINWSSLGDPQMTVFMDPLSLIAPPHPVARSPRFS